MRFCATFFVITCFISTAYATSQSEAFCEEVDLSQEMPGVRDQGDGNYCVAFATADALGYELGLSPLEVISATQLVAIQRSPLKLSAEAERMVIEQVKPFFSKEEVNDFRKTLPNEYFAAMSDDDMMSWMGKLKFAVHEGMFGWDRPEGAWIVPTLIVAQLQSSLCTEADLPSEPFKANLPSEQKPDVIRQTLLQKVFKSSHDPKLKNFTLAENIEKFCETSPRSVHVTKKININAMSNSSTSYEARKRKEKYLLEALNMRKPVMVSYDACGFVKACPRGEVGSHASIIVGKRWNASTKQCEVKLKNSWGRLDTNCASLKNCERGYHWIPLEQATEKFWELVYLTSENL